MDTNALKRFAQAARNLLIDQVTAKLAVVVDPASSARRENPGAMKKLDAAIAQMGQTQVVEQVAYTWFNRFTALRFMDVNGYTNPRVVSPEGDATRPELLAEAIAGNLPEGAPATIAALLDGRTPSRDPQGEAYRLLLVHACNAWHATMPFMFEKVGDYTELLMPEDLLSQTSILARLRDAMPEDDCKDVEIIGWLYQFYISEKKDEVFAGLKKNQKITAENIPAATQLFTPHWIVRYLVENSLGRLWLLNRPGSKLAEMQDVLAVVGRDLFTDELQETLLQFEQAKNFGSLIVPKLRDPAETLRLVQARDFDGDLLLKEVQERVGAVLHMAEALSPKYHVVVANPPYMGGKGMNSSLASFARKEFPDSKADLYAMFMERALVLTTSKGMMSMINMQSWMFLSSYEKLRVKLLSSATLLSMAHQGERGFDTIGGAVVSTTAFVFQGAKHSAFTGTYVRLVDGSSEAEKAMLFREAISGARSDLVFSASGNEFESVPGSPFVYWLTPTMVSNFERPPLADEATFRAGLQTGDNDRFLRFWHEVSNEAFKTGCKSRESAKSTGGRWFPHNKGGGYRKWYGNNEYAIKWEDDGREIKTKKALDLASGKITANNSKCWNQDYYFIDGLTWSSLSSNEFSLRANGPGFLFDTKGQMLFPTREGNLYPYLGLLNSSVASAILAALSPTLDFNGGVVARLPLCDLRV